MLAIKILKLSGFWGFGVLGFWGTSAEHALLMDANPGQVLWQKDGMTPMPPASMSKLMTLDILFQHIKDGRIKLTDTLPVSERAWRTQGSKMFVELGNRIAVEDTHSRNYHCFG